MEKSEPTLVPQWLRSAGSFTGGGSSFQHGTSSLTASSSSLRTDGPASLGHAKNRSNSSVHRDGPPPSVFPERSSGSRRSFNSDGSCSLNKHPYSSFARMHRGEKERDKDRALHADHRDGEPIPGIVSGKNASRRTLSPMCGPALQRSAAAKSRSCARNTNANGVEKVSFDTQFPHLSYVEEIGRASLLPLGSSALVSGEGWVSALAEAPPLSLNEAATTSTTPPAGLNMAEAVAQPPARSLKSPEITVQTQRLEELAIRQSRQLIPMTAASKSSVSKMGSRAVDKAGQSPSRSKDVVRNTSHCGRFLVLKSVRENGGSSSSSAAAAATTVAVTSGAGVRGGPRGSSSPQLQSRNDFFNLVRKKSSPGATLARKGAGGDDGDDPSPGSGDGDTQIDGGGVHVVRSADIEEEEARFLRSLGWDENQGEEGGLTEEEISSFLDQYVKIKPLLKLRK